MRWTLINTQTGRIENIIEWDGVTPYPIDEGYELRPWQEGDTIWQPPVPTVLTASQFHYMLAIAGLHTVIKGVMDYLDSNSHPMFAEIYGHMAGQSFERDRTLQLVGQLRPLSDSLYPQADTSDENILAKWEIAAGWNV